MALKRVLYFVFIFAVVKYAVASISFSGVDIKNMKDKYHQIKSNNNIKENINNLFLKELKKANYMNNNVIILSTSRYYYNYRHTTNILIAYDYLKNVGDNINKNILLMVPFDHTCDCRNILHGTIYKNHNQIKSNSLKDNTLDENLYKNINIDYKNNNIYDIQLRRVIRHRYDGFMPYKTRLYTTVNKEKNLIIYMTGHGGEKFLKIQEFNIISSAEFKLYLQELIIKQIYKSIFVIIETCRGYSFYNDILYFLNKNKINNIFLLASSNPSENSYSLFSSGYLGVSTIDRFTNYFFTYLDNISKTNLNEQHKNVNSFLMHSVMNYLKTKYIISTPTVNKSNFNVSSLVHSKNIIFYNSNLLLIAKDQDITGDHIINTTNYDNKQYQNNNNTLNFQNTCLGDLTLCKHMKNKIYTYMATLYMHMSYYNNMDLFEKKENFFNNYYFTYKNIDIEYLTKIIIIAFLVLFIMLNFLIQP
ncbi:GPI-anchor transamidase, putative [Hepatocystis sp. ex Piliocolobus tephrosceles]|uniref:GPI-anchor transamidase n=2 Tax=Piliocolobus tephrosceles TaxID=591936 RepID=A0A8C9H6F2_9PRIM|nr:GPI-anchor transamidase, putative [Hepatocystis sp. ex Piliocolobus tephrosceles]